MADATESDGSRHATAFPGGGYHHDLPLLLYAGLLLQERGYEVRRVTWDDDVDGWPAARAQADDELRRSPCDVVVGKSLGTLALPTAVELGLPGIWLTPLIGAGRDRDVIDALPKATAPMLLVGGTADPAWDGAVARTASAATVVELDGADHALAVPGTVASVACLQRVVEAMAAFLDRL